MGQISLPRLNRIGCSMFWESALYTELKPSIAIKNYIFLQYLSKYFFFFDYLHRVCS